MQARQKDARYTIRDYRAGKEGEYFELIDGVVYDMSPAPRVEHQRIAGEIFGSLYNFLKGKPCEVFSAPIDVYFAENEDEDTVVQPDIIVVCDPGKVREHGIVGAPDVVAEVLSPSTAVYDLTHKLRLYQSKGVPEYWVVSGEKRTVFRYTLEGTAYRMEAFEEGSMPSLKLNGFSLDIPALFSQFNEEGTPT